MLGIVTGDRMPELTSSNSNYAASIGVLAFGPVCTWIFEIAVYHHSVLRAGTPDGVDLLQLGFSRSAALVGFTRVMAGEVSFDGPQIDLLRRSGRRFRCLCGP